MSQEEKPKLGKIIEGAEQLSLGISMVVAVLIGVALGLGLKTLFGHTWLLFVGVFIGVGAAGLNVYRAYKKQVAELDTLKDDPKYKHYNKIEDEDDEKY
jgi:F0F1-type ATP synthase assembly protein I